MAHKSSNNNNLDDFSHSKRTIATIIIILASFMDLLDSTIVNVAIPSIQSDIKATYAQIQWITAGYALTFAIFLIIGGRLGDIFGRKKIFLLGMFGFTLSSILCGFSVNPIMLIISRLFQGSMAAIMVPQVLAMIKVFYTDDKSRNSVTGIFSALAGLASVSGPILGALLIQGNYFGLQWRPIFLVNLLIGFIGLIVGLIVIPENKSETANKVDYIGMLLITSALFLLVYPIIQGRELGWPLWSFIMMAVSFILLIIFIFNERIQNQKHGSPLVVLSLFSTRSFSSTVLLSGIFMSGIGAFFLIYTLFLQIGLGYSPIHAGLTSVPMSIGISASAGLSAILLIPRIGKNVLTLGALITAIGMFMLMISANHFGITISSWQLLPGLVIAGIGMGMIFAPVVLIAISDISSNDAGSASGLINTVQQLGGAVGIALIGVVFFTLLSNNVSASINKVTPQLKNSLTSIGIPSQAQSLIVNSFDKCFKDRLSEKDPSVIPSSCNFSSLNSSPLSKKIGNTLSSSGQTANAYNFEKSFEQTMWYEIVVFLLTCLVSLFVPYKKIDTTNMEPSI